MASGKPNIKILFLCVVRSSLLYQKSLKTINDLNTVSSRSKSDAIKMREKCKKGLANSCQCGKASFSLSGSYREAHSLNTTVLVGKETGYSLEDKSLGLILWFY